MRLSYLQKGEGKDLVMLHGYLSSKESFYPQINYFSKFYRVTALDFPGFGGADEIPYAYSVSDYADWTVKCLSRGGAFERAVLCGCAGIVPKRTFRYKARVKAYRVIKKFAPRYAERRFGSAEYRSLSPLMRESYKKIVNEDLREDAKKISRPVLFINGEKDGETPPSSAEIYAACVRGSRTLVLKGCGHFAHLDDPLAFNLAAEEFLL